MSYRFDDSEWIDQIIVPALSPPGGSVPFIIGIAGPSGIGKTTIAAAIERNLSARGRKVFRFGMDDFFVGPDQRARLDEWGPDHVRLEELSGVLRAIREGRKTFDPARSVRRPRRALISWKIDLSETDVIVFEGLYALSSDPGLGGLRRFVDLAIYLSAGIEDVKRWRWAQEAEKPDARSEEAMGKHWTEGIRPDIEARVAPSAANADWIFVMDSEHRFRATRGPASG